MDMDIICRADGSKEEARPANGKNYTLVELEKIVGGPIEFFGSPNKKILMAVHRDGKNLQLNVNVYATIIAALWGYYDVIVGDVLVCQRHRII